MVQVGKLVAQSPAGDTVEEPTEMEHHPAEEEDPEPAEAAATPPLNTEQPAAPEPPPETRPPLVPDDPPPEPKPTPADDSSGPAVSPAEIDFEVPEDEDPEDEGDLL
jgi:hypothetical protein